MSTSFVRLTTANIHLLEQFLQAAGESTLASFRYFNSRPKEIIANHIVTYLVTESSSGLPIAYGHLDPDGTKVWLGIAVIEAWQGRGIGKQMMNRLLEEAISQRIPEIHLTVDKDNKSAIRLYENMEFLKSGGTDSYYEFKKVFA